MGGDNKYRGFSRSTWKQMIRRCTDPNCPDFKWYGERGISVYKLWREDFRAFVDDLYSEIGERPPGMQLDRKDNSKGYEPGNVRWVTSKTNNNNRRSNKLITWRGHTRTASEWSDHLQIKGLTRQQIANRINRGWSPEKVFTTPVSSRVRILYIRGIGRSVTEWAGISKVKRTTISERLRKGMAPEFAVFGPKGFREE